MIGGWSSTRRLVWAVLAVVLILPATAQAHPNEFSDKLRQNHEDLQAAKQGLEIVQTQVADTQAAIDALNARLNDQTTRLHQLEGQLAAAREAEAQAESQVAEVTAQLEAETRRLEETQADLARREELFDRRAAATFKYGTATYADALVGARTFTEFLNSYYYVRSALQYEDRLIAGVSQLVRDITEQRAQIDSLREQAVHHEREAEAARAQVQGVTTDQRSLTEQIATDRSERQSLLSELESSQQEYEALVASLEAESASLAEELRRTQWRAGAPGAGELVWPTDGRLSSSYGWRTHPIFGSRRMHTGIDISGSTGQPVVAAAEGLVVHAGYRGGYGLAVVIDHGGGLATLYAHQSAIGVSQGQVVSRGQVVGRVGCTGYCTGPHLHYEVRVNGDPQNPMRWY
ncbi:MAG: peptidoglycan DD-metalloendopeptidase family protein [Actinobacteria bacterium]|nr:peptidoglycan DD-metalloendopeptidase family protein [Actinomycetota bacterium]